MITLSTVRSCEIASAIYITLYDRECETDLRVFREISMWTRLGSARANMSTIYIAGTGSMFNNKRYETMSNGVGMVLTHWGQDKMAAVLQKTFSNAFSWVKIFLLWLKFYWTLSDNGLAPNTRLAIIWIKVGIGYRRIYASPSLNELI